MVTPSPNAKTAQRRIPRKVTPERLANIALYYLERYASSAENLRRVLERRVFKAAHARPDTDLAAAKGWIDDLIKRYIASGLLDDQTFATARARTLHTHGNAPSAIRMKLRAKGVSQDHIEAALQTLSADVGNMEWTAAVRYAKRRRLGPFRDPAKRSETRDKDLAALARNGFSYDTAQRIVAAESAEDLDDALGV